MEPPTVAAHTSGSNSNFVTSGATVEPLISHTPRWIARAMGYERLWFYRGQFSCKFQFGSGLNLGGMGGYGLWELCVMRVSTY